MNRIPTALALSVIAAVSVIMFNTLPVFLGAAAETRQYGNALLGSLASSYFAGHTLMTVVIGITLRRIDLRRAGLAAALLTAFSFFTMAFTSSSQLLAIELFVAGLGGGSLFVMCLTALTCGERPTRGIGLCFMMQMILAAALVYLCPAFITPKWGLVGVALLFAVLFVFVAGLMSVFSRPDTLAAVALREEGETLSLRFKPAIGLIMMAVFFVGMSAVWAFVERIGNSSGFAPAFVGAVLMGSLLAGCLASLLTVYLENHVGIRIPIAFSCVLIVAALFSLTAGGAERAAPFALAVIGFQFGWVLAVNYIAAAVAWLDRVGDHASLLPASMGIGVILGPTVAGLISSGGYGPVIGLGAAIALLVVFVLVATPLLRGARQAA